MPPIHPRLTIPQTSHIRPYVELSELGQITDDAIKHNNRDGAHIDCYVIMPNHIHIIFVLSSPPDERGIAGGRGGAGDRGRSPRQMVVRNMEAYIPKQIGFSPWQKSFHDHIIRNEYEYARIAEYIENNPANWENDCFYAAPPDSHTPKGRTAFARGSKGDQTP
jgi:REP element-mobilizing transposase RayT